MMLRKTEKRRISSGVFCIGTFLLLFLVCAPCPAQGNLPQVRANGQTLPLAWTGGLNACHFAAIDLDGDGKNDYIAFDRIGSRVLCFSSDWQPMPGLEHRLPPLQYWVQAHDYDGDGKQDLFTFNGISGISLYKNISEKTPEGYRLKFEQVSKGLPAEMFGTSSPLYCTWADYPVIADIDGDGDLDVLNFWVPTTGDFLLYYRNYAVEELHRADTFLLKVEDWSWGCFVENEESNAIILDSCSFRQTRGTSTAKRRGKAYPGAAKHAGSTMFAIQNPGSGLFDIVLGDVGYPGLLFLHNGGTPGQAHITGYDTVFPLSEPCRLYNFPLLSPIMRNDSLCYVISPFETDPFNAQGAQSLWLYADTGGGAAYGKLLQKDFLQDRMLDFGTGATPVAYDYNRDGKTDLVVGNYGQLSQARYQGGSWITQKTASLALLENTGSNEHPAFELKTTDYLGLSRYGLRALHPAFADLDGDGQDEMVLGMEDGRLWLFRLHEDGEGADLLDSLFLGAELSGFSAPVFFDLNQDGLLDLIVGEKQRSWKIANKRITKGSLSFYQNTGAKTGGKNGKLPGFSLITDSLGGVDVIDRGFSNFGYSRPSFFKDEQGEILLACGSENGEVFLYDRINGNLQGRFRLRGRGAANNAIIQTGLHAAPLLYDFDGDGKPELIVGNQCGGLQFFYGTDWHAVQGTVENGNPAPVQTGIRLFPNPARNGFRAEVPLSGKYMLSDIYGRILKRFDWREGLHDVDISRLPSGLYFLRPENPALSPQKIIKR